MHIIDPEDVIKYGKKKGFSCTIQDGQAVFHTKNQGDVRVIDPMTEETLDIILSKYAK